MKKNKYVIYHLIKAGLVLWVLLLNVSSCKSDKDTDCINGEKGVLLNMTGVDGCGWIIQLSNSTKLEPINLDDFDIKLEEGKEVCVHYIEIADMGSTCMVGTIVEIKYISD